MAESVVIIIPSQGDDTGAFGDSARRIAKDAYGNNATIVRAVVTPVGESFTVSFTTLKGAAFSWAGKSGITRVLTISHAFSGDGPNLAYHGGGYQPWGTDDTGAALTPGGKTFWASVGRSMTPGGKVLLLGCLMGLGRYAQLVADASNRDVYASTSLFAAGNSENALRYVLAIEAGRVPAPMKKFAPLAAMLAR